MATIREVRLVDDLDGGEADETVELGLDGKTYEIDVSSANAGKLREALAEFIAAGRRISTGKPRPAGSPRPSREASEAREWLAANGYDVSRRGRVPADLLDAYRQRRVKTEQEQTPQPGPELDLTDDAVLSWHRDKGYKVPDDGKVSGLMRHRYEKAHHAA